MEGFLDVKITGLGSMVTRQPPEKVSAGFAIDVRNCRWKGDVVGIRPGKRVAITSSLDGSRITGLGQFDAIDFFDLTANAERINLLYASNLAALTARFEREVTNGSQSTTTIESGAGLDIYAQFTHAYGRMFIARSDLDAPLAAPQQYYKYSNAMRLAGVGLANSTQVVSSSSEEPSGNMTPGTRYIAVLPVTHTGYIGGIGEASVYSVNITGATSKLRVTLPIFADTNVIGRIVAFTPAGGSTAGPWFYIAEDDIENGITQTTTKVNNIDPEFTFNFTDEFLQGLDDITDLMFDQEPLANQTSMYFSKSLRRLMAWGDSKDLVRVSDFDDPEIFRHSTGFIQVGPGDGQKVRAVIEFKSEVLIMKDDDGYVVADTSSEPSQWNVPRRWQKAGPSGPRAVDACEEFVAIASPGGLLTYDGNVPELRTNFCGPTWARINWNYGHLVWVKIDGVRQEILVGVPFDNSILPDKVLCFDYSRGLDRMRLSVDDSAVGVCAEMQRDLPAPPNPVDVIDPSLKHTQILFGSSVSNSFVMLQDPTAINDNNMAIDQRYRFAYIAPAGSGVYRLGGLDLKLGGTGLARAVIHRLPTGETLPDPISVNRPFALDGYVRSQHRLLDGVHSEAFSIEVTNALNIPSAFDLHSMTLWINQAWENAQ